MLDVGWSELVLIGVAALIFVGPKDLPRMFHALGRFTAKARGMARELQRAMDDAAKSSGLDDVRKDMGSVEAEISVLTNPAGYGINAIENAARKFENWDPKTVLKPVVASAKMAKESPGATTAKAKPKVKKASAAVKTVTATAKPARKPSMRRKKSDV
ncbi:MAG: twin-arginine translocase subunit TatB [Rhodobacteraceae bacterium]|nr:twin-arginine translocase subunit TatB [Paracoccaceae bacterium]